MAGFRICRIDDAYGQYLRKFDSRVSWKVNRPFLAHIVMDGKDYAIPITSKEKRENGKARNQRTTTPIVYRGVSYGALLHNNMIPVIPEVLQVVDIDHETEHEKQLLLPKAIFIRTNLTQILSKANAVYRTVVDGKDPFMTSFCCNFELLEQKCIDYCKMKGYTTELGEVAEAIKPTTVKERLAMATAETTSLFSHKTPETPER